MARLNSYERLLLDDPLEPGEEEPELPPPPKPPVPVLEEQTLPGHLDRRFGPLTAERVRELLAETQRQNRTVRAMVIHPADFADILHALNGVAQFAALGQGLSPGPRGYVGAFFGVDTFVRHEASRGTVLFLDSLPFEFLP
jgi:hypothetical protein